MRDQLPVPVWMNGKGGQPEGYCHRQMIDAIRRVWAAGGYTGRLVDWAKETLRLTLEIVKRSNDARGFVVLLRRWVVERTLNWLMRSRRLARDYESRPDSSEAAVLWSMTMLMGRRLARHRPPNITRPPAAG
ncbi:transposase [Streptomyces sp. MBT42]|uniref:transposase n=1 Tax=Streptomyces sp. MBT42 TaxID=1488373 RepID=UPI0035A82654